jgi:hypothetical protein
VDHIDSERELKDYSISQSITEITMKVNKIEMMGCPVDDVDLADLHVQIMKTVCRSLSLQFPI